MTKTKLIAQLAALHPNTSDKVIAEIVRIILGEMSDTIATGGRIEIRGFGSFSLRKWKSRYARNPRTGESWRTQPTNAVHFKAGKELRERANRTFKLEQDKVLHEKIAASARRKARAKKVDLDDIEDTVA